MECFALVGIRVTPANQNPPPPPGIIAINLSYTKAAQIIHPTQPDCYIAITSFDTSFNFEYPNDFLCGCILYRQLSDTVPISSELLDRVVSQIFSCAHYNQWAFNTFDVILTATVFNVFEEVEAQEYASEDCCICLEKFFDKSSTSTQVVRSNCCHVFHQDCILRWLNTSNRCPLCRFELSV